MTLNPNGNKPSIISRRARLASFHGFSDCAVCLGHGPCAQCEDDLAEIEFWASDEGQSIREMDAMLDQMFLENDPIECLEAPAELLGVL